MWPVDSVSSLLGTATTLSDLHVFAWSFTFALLDELRNTDGEMLINVLTLWHYQLTFPPLPPTISLSFAKI